MVIIMPNLTYHLAPDLVNFDIVWHKPDLKWPAHNQSERLRDVQDSYFFVSGSPSFVIPLWGGGINRDRKEVLISVGYRVIKFRGRHRSWRLVHHHRVGVMTKNEVWVGLGAASGNSSMEAILRCGVPRTLNKIWYKTYKLKSGGAAAYQELSVKNGKGDKESVSTGVFISHKVPLCLIEVPSMFTRPSMTSRYMGAKELGQAYNQPEQEMAIMNNYSTRSSALPFLTSIPEKFP